MVSRAGHVAGATRTSWRGTTRHALLTYVAVLLTVPAVALLVTSMSHLREAYLHREASGEGIMFAWVGILGSAGAVLVLTAAALLLETSRGLPRLYRIAVRVLAATMTAGVLACCLVASEPPGRSRASWRR